MKSYPKSYPLMSSMSPILCVVGMLRVTAEIHDWQEISSTDSVSLALSALEVQRKMHQHCALDLLADQVPRNFADR